MMHTDHSTIIITLENRTQEDIERTNTTGILIIAAIKGFE